MAFFAAVVGATALLAYDYSYAASRPTGQTVFALFWIAQAVVIVPVALRLLAREASREERLALLTVTALFEIVPKFLRNPAGPIFHDELIHAHQADVVFTNGHLFAPNSLLTIIQFFPGLEALTAALRNLTGLSTYDTGLIIVAGAHVLSALAVWQIVRSVTASDRTASVAAFFFILNPAFMFFDAQYSYESLAIVFFLWTLACAVRLASADGQPHRQTGWFAAGLLLAGACIITHHVTSYALSIMLVVIAVFAAMARRRARAGSRRQLIMLVALAGITCAGTLLWLAFVATKTVTYLGPHLQQGISGVLGLIGQRQSSRTLFTASTVPSYERYAAFLTPVIIAFGAFFGLRAGWRQSRQTAMGAGAALVSVGLLYFASLPVMLTSQSEEARRFWTFAWIGLAVLIAPGIVALVDRMRRINTRTLAAVAVTALLGVILVGDVTTQANVEYRFPGPYVYGSDARSVTQEITDSAVWLRQVAGPGTRVIAARDDALAFGTVGDSKVAGASGGFPVWDLYTMTGLPPQWFIAALANARFTYLVIDQRMALYLPRVGAYFVAGEPASVSSKRPPLSALQKFDAVPWATRIYSSENIRIYRLDLNDLRLCPTVRQAPLSLLPGCRAKK